MLVTMPMAAPDRPSLPLGLLASIGRSHGFTVDTLHAQLDFAELLGPALVRTLFNDRHHYHLGDWFFTAEAFGEAAPAGAADLRESYSEVLDVLSAEATELAGRRIGPDDILAIREDAVPRFLDRLEREVDWASYDLVGFTSTFEQTVASIALAKRIKAIRPDTVVVGGGANFEGEMGQELLRATPCFDFAVSGEADEAFPALLTALCAGKDPSTIPGVLSRRRGQVVGRRADVFRDMDDLPIPDYDEYFARLEHLELVPPSNRRDIALPFESSRGCWWGVKRHCTFCGLNGATMDHRAKEPKRVLAELGELTRRYRSFHLRATDNIVDERYFDELLPELVADETDFELFYEIKANLDRRRIELLSRAGIREIQPGIESLSSHMLRLMDKGARAATNVNVLRWGTHLEMYIHWNLLCGFPGETRQDFTLQAELAEQLVHLQPPIGSGLVVMERFSPMFTDRERFPVRFMEPEAVYRLIYPASYDLDKVAYYFDYEFADRLPADAYAPLHDAVDEWKALWEPDVRPSLELWRAPDVIHIEDRRNPEEHIDFAFEGELREIYLACFDEPRSVRQLVERAGGRYSRARLEVALDGFCEHGLMMRDGNLMLSLALPRRRPARPRVPGA
jgi:ribosomal peptide maturation radical SAM protein 1